MLEKNCKIFTRKNAPKKYKCFSIGQFLHQHIPSAVTTITISAVDEDHTVETDLLNL